MTRLRTVIKNEIIAYPNALTVCDLVLELEGAYTECEVQSKVRDMLQSDELGLDCDMQLFVKDSVTVKGVINSDGSWEPMISIPISEYEELREKAAAYDDIQEMDRDE